MAALPSRAAPSAGKFSEYSTQFQPWHHLMKSTPNLEEELKHDKKERASSLKVRSMTAEGRSKVLAKLRVIFSYT